MSIIAWIVLGLIAGVLAKFIMPGRDPGGIIVTILIGIAGALVGGFISTKLGYGAVDGLRHSQHHYRGAGGHSAAHHLPHGPPGWVEVRGALPDGAGRHKLANMTSAFLALNGARITGQASFRRLVSPVRVQQSVEELECHAIARYSICSSRR